MLPIEIVSQGAVCAAGMGVSSLAPGPIGHVPESTVMRDPTLADAGLSRPLSARVDVCNLNPSERASGLLMLAARQLQAELDDWRPDWARQRVAVIVGTSSGGMQGQLQLAERMLFKKPVSSELARSSLYCSPLLHLLKHLAVTPRLSVQLLGACASSTFAIGLGCRWLELGRADLVLAGGYDALNPLVAAGFEALKATAARVPAPFRVQRDGMVLGEGAGMVALCRTERTRRRRSHVLGFGASSDAVHVTSPDLTGRGLAAAAERALTDAAIGSAQIDLLSAHATATLHNDAAEARAISQVLGTSAGRVVVQPLKAVIGHTLGAAGILECLGAITAMQQDVLPAALGDGPIMSDFHSRLLPRNESGNARRALKLSSAFGGLNSALVLGEPAAGSAMTVRPVTVSAVAKPVTTGDAARVRRFAKAMHDRLDRLDPLSELVLTSVADVLGRVSKPLPTRTAVIVGSVVHTLEENWDQETLRLTSGKLSVMPRRFPATSPNLCAGLCSIAFQWTGPTLAVGGGMNAALEALLVGHDLIAAGDAEAAVVVAVDNVGPAARALFEAAAWPTPAHGALSVLLAQAGNGRPCRDPAGLIARLAKSADCRVGWPSLRAAVAG